MARVRVRLRPIQHDGQAYVWRAHLSRDHDGGNGHRAVRVRVWSEGQAGHALQADLVSAAWPTPDEVGVLVGHAREHGWEPGPGGKTFVLTDFGPAAPAPVGHTGS